MKLRLILAFSLISAIAIAQKGKNPFYVFDSEWNPSDLKKAIYFVRVHKINDSSYAWVYNKMFGPRIKEESYKDEKASIRNGKFAYYNAAGLIDS